MQLVKVIVDGTPDGTKIVDAATGEPIKGIVGIALEQRVHELPRLVLTQLQPMAEITAEADIEHTTLLQQEVIALREDNETLRRLNNHHKEYIRKLEAEASARSEH